MNGITRSVKAGLSASIVVSVKLVVNTVRKMAGTRSDPKYDISSIGSLRGYTIAPIRVLS